MDDLLRETGAEQCIGCGRCTYSCPVSHRYEGFSPRKIVEDLAAGKADDKEIGLWSCVTCGNCTTVCTNGVDFQEFVLRMRRRIRSNFPPVRTHNGMLDSIRELSSQTALRPRTDRWRTPDLKIDNGSDSLLFVGCTPFFDVVFQNIRSDLLNIPRSALKMLNAIGTSPRLLKNERCCGHDAYWLGDDRTFDRLAAANVEAIEATGVKEVIVLCPECLYTLRELYPRRIGRSNFKVVSVTEKMAEAIKNGSLSFAVNDEHITFQDPCRFSKHLGIVNEPRTVLERIGKLAEMPRSGELSACCGTSCWINCDGSAKALQVERLREAASTGASSLITACPKCLIHLSCAAKHHPDEIGERIDVQDIHMFAARNLKNDLC